jgi:general secretion pathway protein D
VKDRVREGALPGLILGPGADEPLGLTFRNASLREAYQALGRIAGVNFIFDPQFQDQTITIDLKDVPFEEALTALASVGRTFYRVAESHIVNVIPDTPAKRRDYEQQVVRTFFLSNADLKETIDLLRVVLGARRVAPLPGANALTINDTPDKVAAAARIIDVVDKQRSEVVVEVEILEVNRSRLKDYGIEITSALPGVEGVVGAIFPSRRSRRRPPTPTGTRSRRAAPDPQRQPLLEVAARHHGPARRHLPPAQDRHLHPPPGQPAAADERRRDRPGPLRRPGARCR